MSDSDTEYQHDPAEDAFDTGETGRRVATLTGMSEEAAATFAAFHTGRFAASQAFRDAA